MLPMMLFYCLKRIEIASNKGTWKWENFISFRLKKSSWVALLSTTITFNFIRWHHFRNLVSSSKTKWKYNTYILIVHILIVYVIAYIFHVAINISLQNVIHTALNVLLLANLFFRQNESTAYLSPHFS